YACDIVDETLTMSAAKANNAEVYTWTVAGETDSSIHVTSSGDFTGFITNKCGLDSTQWTVILKNTPVVNLPKDSTYCNSVKTIFDVTDTDSEMLYEWQDKSTLSTFTVNGSGLYAVKLSNRCGSDSDQITIDLLYSPTVSLGEDLVFCGQVESTSYNIGTQNNSEVYLWSSGGVTDQATFNTEGTHWVTILNKCATVSDSVNYSVSPYPIVSLGLDTILCGKFSVPLDAGNSGMAYNWLPDGETTQKINATKQQLYRVIVTNIDGCESGDDFEIGSGCISSYHVPTGFSPNNDGVNDLFKPTLVNYQDFSMSIYNRWGEEIFKSNDPNIGWDGTYNGEVVMNGVYLYAMRFITTEDEAFKTVKGLVHVVR
ncbi:MAG: gliding motility-associated-like protein, partial [Bacteroidia bacterium]